MSTTLRLVYSPICGWGIQCSLRYFIVVFRAVGGSSFPVQSSGRNDKNWQTEGVQFNKRRRNGIKRVKVEELTVHPPVACWGGGCVAEAGVQQRGEQQVSQYGQSRRHRSHGFASIDRYTDHSH
jgi:hypothetical protein